MSEHTKTTFTGEATVVRTSLVAELNEEENNYDKFWHMTLRLEASERFNQQLLHLHGEECPYEPGDKVSLSITLSKQETLPNIPTTNEESETK